MCNYFVKGWLLILYIAGTTVGVQLGAQQAAVLEPIPIENIQQGRHALEKWEQQAAAESGVMNIILGNTCFTTAISHMKQGCTRMDSTNRCWLAIQFTMCFQRASGFKVMDCPAVCPKYRRLQACVEDCTAKMDPNTYNTYTHFFSDVFNMCLFLQTQNFQEFTTALVQDMHMSSAAANATLGSIRRDLADQRQAVLDSMQTLKDVKQVQLEVRTQVEAGLAEVQKVGQMSIGLQKSMNTSLEMTDVLTSHQLALQAGFSNLSEQHRQHVEEAAAAWQQLTAGAAALEQRQVRYESLQAQLLNASEGLLSQQQGMASLMELLLHYQHTGSSVLNHLYSSSTTLQDLAFYTVALSVPLLFITHPPEVRLLLLLAVLVSWITERSIIQHLVPIHNAFAGSRAAADAPAAAAAAAAGLGVHGGMFSKTPGHVQGVKLVVRFLMMGGTCGLVMWWMIKREMVRRKKEQTYEDIKKFFAEADGYPKPPFAHGHPMHHHQQAPAAAAAQGQLVPYTPGHGHQFLPATPTPAPAAANMSNTSRPAGRGHRPAAAAATTALKEEQMLHEHDTDYLPATEQTAAAAMQPHMAQPNAAAAAHQYQQQLGGWFAQHNPLPGYFGPQHHTQPAGLLAQQQHTSGSQPAATHHMPYVGNHHQAAAHMQQQALMQLQQHSHSRAHTPLAAGPAAAAAGGVHTPEQGSARQMDVNQLQAEEQQDHSAATSAGNRRSGRGGGAAAATSRGRPTGKRGRPAASVGAIPEEPAASDDGEGHAARRPARKSRRH